MQVDGRSVFVAHGGSRIDPSRPSVVLIHGAGMDHSAWAWQSRALAQRGNAVLAIDLPGHGGSEGPPLDSIAALSDWLVRLLDAAGIAAAALAGHSLGALVALDAAARFPQRVRAIALIGAAARMPVHPALLQAAQNNRAEAIAMVNLWGHGQRAQVGGCPVPGLWMTGLGQRLLERRTGGAARRPRRLRRLSRRRRACRRGALPGPRHRRRPRSDDPGEGRACAGGDDPERCRIGHPRGRPHADDRAPGRDPRRAAGDVLTAGRSRPPVARPAPKGSSTSRRH
ncbi:MAG: alpha/beta fold hydrolase [Rhodospirillales bacterium]